MKVLTAAVLTIFLMFVTLMPLNAVFAASYESSYFIRLTDDPVKRHWADLQVSYTFPDEVKVGTQFDVQVSIAYLKNDNATFEYLDFFGVSVHTRTSPNGTDITDSAVDSSRLRVAPTEQYSRLLTILAPNKPGEYLVVLKWETLNPAAAAGGRHMDSGQLNWDTGVQDPQGVPSLRVIAEETATTATTITPLPVGSWWTLKGSYVWVYAGSGDLKGTLTQIGNYTDKILVASQDSNTTTLSEQVNGSWSCTATGAWKANGWCGTTSGTWSNTTDYTIARDTLVVVSVGQDRNKEGVGHLTFLLRNPTELTEGGTDRIFWSVPNSDAKGSTPTLVDWSVGTQRMTIRGVPLKVWTLTYTGDVLGNVHNPDGVYSKGRETETSLYDSAGGIWIGNSWKSTLNGNQVGATWTEVLSEDELLEDTNLTFVTVNAEPASGVAVTVDGVNYAADHLPTVFSWVIGTTHTFQVDSTIQGAAGVQYVFVQWSDGSKDTSRTLTATQENSLTATFKTQYQLTVSSDLGNPQGGGWYDANTQATFSVASAVPAEGFMGVLGGKYVFDHWSGDVTAATATASVTMDGPKTVKAEWRTDNTTPYIIGLMVAAIAIVVALLLMRRRRVPTPASSYQPPSPAPEVPQAPLLVTPTLPPPAPPGVQPPAGKFCLNCGAPLPVLATYCNECGTKQ